ncbi:radical SAM protein [Streptomyces sp. PmtG]
MADLLAASDVLGHDISGGEPLLLRSLPQLLKALASHGAVVSCTTNGWHLQRRPEELAPPLDAVRVCFDGPDAAAHDHRRGNGSFERAVAGVRAAVAQGIPVQLHAALMQSTAHRAQSVADLAADLGAVGVAFLHMLPIGGGDARRIVESLQPPHGLHVRLRTRELAEGFTVIRADGQVYHNVHGATQIQAARPLRTAADLELPLAEGARR